MTALTSPGYLHEDGSRYFLYLGLIFPVDFVLYFCNLGGIRGPCYIRVIIHLPLVARLTSLGVPVVVPLTIVRHILVFREIDARIHNCLRELGGFMRVLMEHRQQGGPHAQVFDIVVSDVIQQQ